MQRTLVICALLIAGSAEAGWDGLWLQCRGSDFVLLEVRRGGREWGAEWRALYSANGHAESDSKGNLVLRGCSFERDTVLDGCNVDRPPVFATLPHKAMAKPERPSKASLRKRAWLRTDNDSWDKLGKRCIAEGE